MCPGQISRSQQGLGSGSRATRNDPIAQLSRGPKPRKKKSASAILLIGKVSNDFTNAMKLLATERFGQFESCSISSWAMLVQKLQEYHTIENMMIAAHGSPGGMDIEGSGISRKFGEYRTAFLEAAPIVRNIFLEGCAIGLDPMEVVQLGSVFQASKVQTYNLLLHVASIDYSSRDQVWVVEQLGKIKEYLLPGQLGDKGAKLKNGRVFVEFFSGGYNEKELSRTTLQGGTEKPDRGLFQPRSSAQKILIKSAKEFKNIPTGGEAEFSMFTYRSMPLAEIVFYLALREEGEIEAGDAKIGNTK